MRQVPHRRYPRVRTTAALTGALMLFLVLLMVPWRFPHLRPEVSREGTIMEVEGTVESLDIESRTVRISWGPLGLGAKTLKVTDETRIQVGDKEGALANIPAGITVRVAYESRGDTNLARSIQVEVSRPAVATEPIPNQAAPGWQWRNRWSEVTQQPQSQDVPDASDETRAQAPTQRSSGDPVDARRHVIDLIRPAIVHVRTSDAVTRREDRCVARAPDAKSGSPRRRGLGFIIDPGGYIATNNRVVSGSTTIEVTLHDGRTLPVVLLAREPRSDLAVLKVDATGLPTIALGDSNALRVGDHVMSIADPIGEGALAMGIITAIGRDIATNVRINPECHGLPLLNSRGEAVGIAVARVAESGRQRTAALAVPIQRVKPILQDLQTLESPSRR